MPFKQKNDIVKFTDHLANNIEYQLLTVPSNKNSGTGIWAFATKNKVGDFFIKRYLAPKGPSSICDEIENERRKQICSKFLNWKNAVFTEVKKTNSPYLPKPEDFFQAENSFHISYKKLNSVPFDFNLSFEKKIEVFTKIVEAVHQLHQYNIVHADIKMNNVMFDQTATGDFIPYVIDLDSAYVSKNPDEEIVTDVLYQSPETLLYNHKDSRVSKSDLNTKSDVFSLSILLHYLLFQTVPIAAATKVIENKPFHFNYTILNLPLWLEKKLDDLFQKTLSPLSSRIDLDEVLKILKNLFINKISMSSSDYERLKSFIEIMNDKNILKTSFKLEGDEYILDQNQKQNVIDMFKNYKIEINQDKIDLTNMTKPATPTKPGLKINKAKTKTEDDFGKNPFASTPKPQTSAIKPKKPKHPPKF